jgi:hypothetical protein
VEPSLAGPKRPQDRVSLAKMKGEFRKALTAPVKDRGFALAEGDLARTSKVESTGETMAHGAVVIAAIPSCTNTANPSVLGPHLCAAAAESPLTEEGLALFGPGARSAVDALTAAGLLRRRPHGWYWTDRRRACDLADIRSSGGAPVRLVEGRKSGHRVGAWSRRQACSAARAASALRDAVKIRLTSLASRR